MPSAGKLVTDKFDEVTIRGKKFSMLDVLQRLDKVPPIAAMSTQEAGLFLGYSVSQMERMRIAGTGPRYRQTPPEPIPKPKRGEERKKRGTNLHVAYQKAELMAWAEKNTASSAMEHAAKHKRTFATLFEVLEEIPFYVDETGAVEGMAEENSLATVIDRLGVWEIEWMPAVEACSRPWAALGPHRELAGQVQEVLSKARGGVDAGLAATEIQAETLLPAKKRPAS